MGNTHEKSLKTYKDVFQKVQQILLWDWNPIGLDDKDKKKDAKDEYDTYANRIIRLLLDNKSEEEIVKYLLKVERNQMGFNPQVKLLKPVASKLKKIDVSKMPDSQ